MEIEEKEVIDINIDGDNCFKVVTPKENFYGRSIIIATGNKRVTPNIEGIKELEGKGISYCAICDGFFYRNKDVVVIGNGDFAVNEANHLANIVRNVKILTNGLDRPITNNYEVDTRKIKKIHGNQVVESIEFEDGEKVNIDGIFIAEGIAGGASFARKLGIITKENDILVNENMETNINGIYACGNITGGLLQVSKAVYEGAKAGLLATNYVKSFNK